MSMEAVMGEREVWPGTLAWPGRGGGWLDGEEGYPFKNEEDELDEDDFFDDEEEDLDDELDEDYDEEFDDEFEDDYDDDLDVDVDEEEEEF